MRVICRTNQWSGLKEFEVNDWLHGNFKDFEGKYLATKILLHSLCYSEENLVELLRFGVYEKIIGERIKEQLISSSNIFIPKSFVEGDIKRQLDSILFVPLLDNNKPSESANGMLRYLTNQIGVDSSKTIFHFNIKDTVLDAIDKIVIVDDCIGSGEQLNKFWNNTFVEFKKKAFARDISIYYLVLVGNEPQILDLQLDGSLLGLRIIICDKIDNSNRIFSTQNFIWNSPEESQFAVDYFDDVEKKLGVPRLGYGGLDFSLFLHNTVPDWSLPIFWTENYNWKPLLKRKNSNS